MTAKKKKQCICEQFSQSETKSLWNSGIEFQKNFMYTK